MKFCHKTFKEAQQIVNKQLKKYLRPEDIIEVTKAQYGRLRMLEGWQPLRRTDESEQDVVSAFGSVWLNNWYVIMVDEGMSTFGPCTVLKIRRNDAMGMTHWWHMQQIKDEICGADKVGVQVFPKTDDAFDDKHIFWLWVFNDIAPQWEQLQRNSNGIQTVLSET